MLGSFPKLYKAVLTTIGMRGAIYGSPISSQIIDEINHVAQSVGSDRTRTGEREFHSHGRGLYLPRALAPGTQTVWHRPPDCVFIWQSRSDQAMRDVWPGDCILPRATVQEEVEQGKLQALPFAYPSNLYTQAIYLKRKWKSRAFQNLLDLMGSALPAIQQ